MKGDVQLAQLVLDERGCPCHPICIPLQISHATSSSAKPLYFSLIIHLLEAAGMSRIHCSLCPRIRGTRLLRACFRRFNSASAPFGSPLVPPSLCLSPLRFLSARPFIDFLHVAQENLDSTGNEDDL